MFRTALTSTIVMTLLATVALAASSSAAFACEEGEGVVSLNRLQTARAIESREPVGSELPLTADGERVYVFIDVHNPDGPDGELTVVWKHHDRNREYTQTIEYGSSVRWRTWVARRMPERYVGSWSVEVYDEVGTEVGYLEFEVEPQPVEIPVATAVETIDAVEL